MHDLMQQIIDNPTASLIIIGNLILIESLLSIDNAAVLATMVLDLPENQRQKALKYGILGAYVFRGLALLFASVLIKIWWLKPIGGLYLLYLVFDWWKKKQKSDNPEEMVDKNANWLYRKTVGYIGNFWATIALVELMDMAFSIDNVFAAVGILAMRFVAQWFVKLMEKFPFLETSAFIVIAILGLKLSFSIYEHFFPTQAISIFMKSETADMFVSLLTIGIFLVPILFTFTNKKK
jgi:YkoY family integral membrane protein